MQKFELIKMKFKIFAFAMFAILVCTYTCSGQISQKDEIEILKSIANYKDCNQVCVNLKKLEYDMEVKNMMLAVNRNKKSLRSTLRNFYNKRKINYKKVSKEIFNYKLSKDWNENVKIHSPLFDTTDCIYKFSIMKPFEIDKGEVLLLMANYKYNKENYDFDSFVYFYTVKQIENVWMVVYTEHYYDIGFDWNPDKN